MAKVQQVRPQRPAPRQSWRRWRRHPAATRGGEVSGRNQDDATDTRTSQLQFVSTEFTACVRRAEYPPSWITRHLSLDPGLWTLSPSIDTAASPRDKTAYDVAEISAEPVTFPSGRRLRPRILTRMELPCSVNSL